MTCEHKNMKVLHEPTGNRICLDCKQHWHKGKEYTRKEWDAWLEAPEEHDEPARVEW
jgi:hypothetical protein